jgi:xanthine dehydrogenase YagT iron-sulfur-binding subunit
VSITINGSAATLPSDARVSLLDYIRDHLHLPGTKKGCDQGACGACTVLVDGERILSCLALAIQYEGRSVMTIEGLAAHGSLHPLQQAFMAKEIERGAPSHVTDDLAAEEIALTADELRERMSGNLCRCGAYNGIIAAITETYTQQAPI